MGMLTIDDIKQLIASDETRTLELKKTTGELKDVERMFFDVDEFLASHQQNDDMD